MKKLGTRNYALLSDAIKNCGSYDPDQCLVYCEEQLYMKDIEEITAFLKWVHDTGRTFGSGNYEAVFKEFKLRSKMSPVIQRREDLIDKIMTLNSNVRGASIETVAPVIDLTSKLQCMEPDADAIDGMLGFLKWSSEHPLDIKPMEVLSTVFHDLDGIVNQERCFSPRTSSYIKFARQEGELVDAN